MLHLYYLFATFKLFVFTQIVFKSTLHRLALQGQRKLKTPQSLAGPVFYRIRYFNLFSINTCPAISVVTFGTKPIRYFDM